MTAPSASHEAAANETDHTAVRRLLGQTQVSEIMTANVEVAHEHMTRGKVAHLMVDGGFSAMPVVDEAGQICGIITKTDVIREDYGPARSAGAAGQVSKFMTPYVLRLRADSSLAAAVTMMKGGTVHHVVVTNSDAKPIGILSSVDIITWLGNMSAEGEPADLSGS